jgi:hypothetical protein
MDHFSKTCKIQSQLSDIGFSDNLQFSSNFAKKQIESSYEVTLCDLVTAFVETQSITKSRFYCSTLINVIIYRFLTLINPVFCYLSKYDERQKKINLNTSFVYTAIPNREVQGFTGKSL